MPYGNQCRFCGRTIDLPIGDECAKCQDFMNWRSTQRVARLTNSAITPTRDGKNLGYTLNGVTFHTLVDGMPVTRLSFGEHSYEAQVREDINIFFYHRERIQIDQLRWGGEER